MSNRSIGSALSHVFSYAYALPRSECVSSPCTAVETWLRRGDAVPEPLTSTLGIMRKLLVSFVALTASFLAFAAPDEEILKEVKRRIDVDPEHIRAYYDACDDGRGWRMMICGYYRWTAEDLRLNALYKKALEVARAERTEHSLKRTQRAWLAYRDAACVRESSLNPGADSILYELSCKRDLTAERANRIERLERLQLDD